MLWQMKKHIDISHMISMYMLSYWLFSNNLSPFPDIKLLWQSKWPWRWNNDNTHQCAQPLTALQNMRSIMLNIKQIVSRKEENGVYGSKRGLMEHVKRRKVGVYYIAIPHICHGHHGRRPCKFFLPGVNFNRFNAKNWQFTDSNTV